MSEEFEKLEKLGFYSDMVIVSKKAGVVTISPAFTADYLLERGFYPKGTRLVFYNQNGRDFDREYALKQGLEPWKVYTVKSCMVGDWYSHYEFEEVEGKFNTVMFGPEYGD